MTDLENEIHEQMVGIALVILLLIPICLGVFAMYNSPYVDTGASYPCTVEEAKRCGERDD